MEPFMGQVMCVGFNYAPKNYAFCAGQIVAIAQNTALFSLLGTQVGGDGRVTFGLPDLRGRVPVGMGQSPGLSNYTIGQMAGTETVTLLPAQMPQHTHAVRANAGDANDATPANAFPSAGGTHNTAANTTMNPAMVGAAGGNQPHPNMQPYLVLNWIIALTGIFPSRSSESLVFPLPFQSRSSNTNGPFSSASSNPRRS
ncbi:MAG: phage tail protein [Acidobacteria bacterium]|nr:phage tail protein [Acidobacteriota bacterium]